MTSYLWLSFFSYTVFSQYLKKWVTDSLLFLIVWESCVVVTQKCVSVKEAKPEMNAFSRYFTLTRSWKRDRKRDRKVVNKKTCVRNQGFGFQFAFLFSIHILVVMFPSWFSWSSWWWWLSDYKNLFWWYKKIYKVTLAGFSSRRLFFSQNIWVFNWNNEKSGREWRSSSRFLSQQIMMMMLLKSWDTVMTGRQKSQKQHLTSLLLLHLHHHLLFTVHLIVFVPLFTHKWKRQTKKIIKRVHQTKHPKWDLEKFLTHNISLPVFFSSPLPHFSLVLKGLWLVLWY